MTNVWFCYSKTKLLAYWTIDEDAYQIASRIEKYDTKKMVRVGDRDAWLTGYDGRVYVVTGAMISKLDSDSKWNQFPECPPDQAVTPQNVTGVTLEELFAEDEGE